MTKSTDSLDRCHCGNFPSVVKSHPNYLVMCGTCGEMTNVFNSRRMVVAQWNADRRNEVEQAHAILIRWVT